MDEREKARQRAELIIRVQSGQMSATDASRELGISRKNYYKWEKRALLGMMDGLLSRSSGRPGLDRDPQKEQLLEELNEAREETAFLKQRLYVREMLSYAALESAKKKGRSDRGAPQVHGGGEKAAISAVQDTVRGGNELLKADEVQKPPEKQ